MKLRLKFLKIDSNNVLVMARVKVNGHPANMLVDTGASRTLFDRETVSHLVGEGAFRPYHGTCDSGVGGTVESETVAIGTLEFGTVKIRDYEAVAADLTSLTEFHRQAGLPQVAGLIGGDLLQRLNANIDYTTKSIELHR